MNTSRPLLVTSFTESTGRPWRTMATSQPPAGLVPSSGPDPDRLMIWKWKLVLFFEYAFLIEHPKLTIIIPFSLKKNVSSLNSQQHTMHSCIRRGENMITTVIALLISLSESEKTAYLIGGFAPNGPTVFYQSFNFFSSI